MLKEAGVEWITSCLRDIQINGIPQEWRRSKLTPIFKQKGDPLSCGNYRGIKLLCHSLKLWERIVEARIREMVKIRDNQYGFQKGKSTMEPMFCLRMLQEKCREYNKELHMVFVDLEKAYDTIPRDLIWYSLRRRGVPEAYVEIIKDMYRDCTTQVVTEAGETDEFTIEVGLHQGSALSPLLFILILDVITEDIDEDVPWAMLFADDLAIGDESREHLEARLETWRESLEGVGLKLSRTKTEHLPPPLQSDSIKLRKYNSTECVSLPQTTSFKYLGTTIHQDGGCKKEVELRISKAWNRWRELSGVLCDKKVPSKLKILIYKTVIRPALLYGNETWPLTKLLENKISSCEMRMLRYCLSISLEEHQTNKAIREKADVIAIQDLMRRKRLGWYGHVCRRGEQEDIRKTFELNVGGQRGRGRPKHRWNDTIEADMRVCGLKREDTQDRGRWKSLVELAIRQKPATRKDRSGER